MLETRIKKTLTLAAILGILAALLLPRPAHAFPELATSLKCESTCHKAENIIQARSDRFAEERCKSCHVGAPARKMLPASHLAPPPKIRPKPVLVSNATKKSAQPAAQGGTAEGMALVPAGEFIMGSNERWDDESPEHIARTEAFYIDINEVTNADYQKFTAATGHEAPYHWPEGNLPKGKEQHPVVYVNWFDARDYCAWKGKRLPTEQEWEKAARGEEGLTYPWGHEWSLKKSNNPYIGSTGTEPVASYPEGKSPYGINDMSGNVWEWVDAYYLPHPGNTRPRPEYGEDKRVLKGGSWFDCLSYGCGLSAPTFNRSFFTPEVRNNSFGFRCAKTP